MKTLLVWGVETELSESVCLELARRDRRLLVAGQSATQVQLLDATLVQSELHRYRAELESVGLADWIKTQRIGLDGLVLFPQPPISERSALQSPEALQAQTGASLLAPLDVIRSLLPQLERGKKPKSILVVLDWHQPASSVVSAWTTILKQAWGSCVRQLGRELASSGLVINVLDPGCLRSDRELPNSEAAGDAGPPVPAPAVPEPAGLPGGLVRVTDAARAAAQLLDDAAPTQSGQLLELGIPA